MGTMFFLPIRKVSDVDSKLSTDYIEMISTVDLHQ